jgi:hypothetical protein
MLCILFQEISFVFLILYKYETMFWLFARTASRNMVALNLNFHGFKFIPVSNKKQSFQGIKYSLSKYYEIFSSPVCFERLAWRVWCVPST